MVTQEMIDRINELARKSKAEGLTEEEDQEQAVLRRKYIDAFKANLRSQLDAIKIVDPDDTEEEIEVDVDVSDAEVDVTIEE